MPPTSSPISKAAATWAQAALLALAREEHHGRRPKRLLEPDRLTWSRFRGHLGPIDLLVLLLEDAAVTQAEPFDVSLLPPEARPDQLTDDLVQSLLDALATHDLAADPEAYLTDQARLLGLPTWLARSSLRKVSNTKQVLERPGTGGQLAFHITHTQPGVFLQDVFTIAYGGWRERALAGLVAVEAGLQKDQLPLVAIPDPDALRALGRRFDQFIGLHPDRHGLLHGIWPLLPYIAWDSKDAAEEIRSVLELEVGKDGITDDMLQAWAIRFPPGRPRKPTTPKTPRAPCAARKKDAP